ncbi:hypothetical protein D9619_004575 [Psilocybe cf. subviscida]|uniref:Probable acetate kinase n=1 Tax=Psilocybe cf. subviscida TaxID=2480587 RepID=A0A8H5BRB9_9AGAR|nr:hypothetical protein D9619_004575 [Psilocybe cf. subviscida]
MTIQLVLTSSISNISSPPARFSFHLASVESTSSNLDGDCDAIHDHASGFSRFLDALKSQASIDDKRVIYICHRVVHGGDYNEPILITQESYDHIERLSDLAPLHNGAALSVIKACISAVPDAKSIAYFDTSFHRSIPLHISTSAIDPQIAKQRGLKKYGFHGLSCKAPESLNLIVLHLGSGASACAIKGGRSLDTSMGLTPLDGLPGATRSGSIDPSLIFHYTNKAGRMTHDPNMATHVGVTRAEDILNRKSGWKSLTGTTDFGQISAHAELDNPSPDVAERNPNRLAFDLFVDRIIQFIGAYHLKLGADVDALVFAGGIGEKSVELRKVTSQKIECLGYPSLDASLNDGASKQKETVIQISSHSFNESAAVRPKQILMCKTDEQYEMAHECAQDRSLWRES